MNLETFSELLTRQLITRQIAKKLCRFYGNKMFVKIQSCFYELAEYVQFTFYPILIHCIWYFVSSLK